MSKVESMPLEFPGARGCPIDPPEQISSLLECPGLTKIQSWNGSFQWLATSYADVRKVLFDKDFSADPDSEGYPHHSAGSQARKQNHTKMFVSLDDPKHRQLRRMATQEFTVKNVELMRPRIREITHQLIDDLLAGDNPVNLVDQFSILLPSIVISDLLGVPVEDRPMFHDASVTLTSRTATAEEAVGALETMREYFTEMIKQRTEEPSDDMVTRLVHDHYLTGEVELNDLVAILELVLVGGHDTTNNMIALGVAVILEHPELWTELGQADQPDLNINTVEELLRYLSIFHMGRPRAVVNDTEVGGQALRVGEGVIAALNVANRDPAIFNDPNSLDVSRPNARSHVAFGFGIHQCLGQTLARVELQEAYVALASRIPTLRLAVNFEDLPFKEDSVVYGVHELPVTW